YYFTYKVGTWILQTPVRDIQFELSTHWLMGELDLIWQPLLLGCLVTSTVLALLGNLAIRLFWRLYVNQSWRKRRQDRAERKRQRKAKNNTN
ncbi:MAG: DUF2062 domain-containing protein, partial [Gammaproteobacteria bacterium]|nr:DUF2062 domain-containing protein [Gammaproteobacteria bacterium]